MGATIATTDGRAAARRSTARALRGIELHAAGRERAGEVGDAARRARRRAGATTVVEPIPTRDHTELMLAGGRRARSPPPGLGRASSRPSALRLAEVRRPGRHLLGRAVPRRRGAAPGLDADDPRRRRSTRSAPGCSTCSSGWAPGSASSTGAASAGEAVGDVEVQPRPSSSRREIEAAEVPRLVDELPLVALLGVVRARRRPRSRGAEELRAKETRPDRDGHRRRCARSASTSRRGPTASSSAAFRRGRAAARSTPPATTGSRCSARSPALVSREGVAIEGADARRR